MDVKTAFLNGDLTNEIYMKQPDGFVECGKEQLVCKLKKSLYGLKQSARCWNSKINEVLLKSGFRRGSADLCLYVKGEGDNLIYVLIYVDDLIFASVKDEVIREEIENMKKYFEIKELGNLKCYLGINVERKEPATFYLDQKHYITQLLTEFKIEDAKGAKIPLDIGYFKLKESNALSNNELYRKVIGSLLYISTNTRPDICAAVSILSRKVSKPNQNDWNEVKRILKYLKGTINYKLAIGNKFFEDTELIGYADADWAGDAQSRKSTSGYIFLFKNSAVSWASKKQDNVTLSSTEAEYVALSETCQEAMWLKCLLKDFGQSDKIKINEDNQSCLKLLKEGKMNPRTKHIDVKYHYIRELEETGQIQFIYCPTEFMLADIFTKPLQRVKFNKLRGLIGLQEEKMK